MTTLSLKVNGQAVTQDETRRKLELVMEVAREVWG